LNTAAETRARQIALPVALIAGLAPMVLAGLLSYLPARGPIPPVAGIAMVLLVLGYTVWLAAVGRGANRNWLPVWLAIVPALLAVPAFLENLPMRRVSDEIDWVSLLLFRVLPLAVVALSMIVATRFASRRLASGRYLGAAVGSVLITALGLFLASLSVVVIVA
jgi:hypothetical protein